MIPKIIGAEKVLPARQVMSSGGGFTMLMSDFINSLLDGEAAMAAPARSAISLRRVSGAERN
jgi:hypothetical protein